MDTIKRSKATSADAAAMCALATSRTSTIRRLRTFCSWFAVYLESQQPVIWGYFVSIHGQLWDMVARFCWATRLSRHGFMVGKLPVDEVRPHIYEAVLFFATYREGSEARSPCSQAWTMPGFEEHEAPCTALHRTLLYYTRYYTRYVPNINAIYYTRYYTIYKHYILYYLPYSTMYYRLFTIYYILHTIYRILCTMYYIL